MVHSDFRIYRRIALNSSYDPRKGVDRTELSSLPPLLMSPDEFDGAQVVMCVGRSLVIVDPEPLRWRGQVADPDVAVFVPGVRDEEVEFHCGIEGLAVGHTSVLLTDDTGRRLSFPLVVQDEPPG